MAKKRNIIITPYKQRLVKLLRNLGQFSCRVEACLAYIRIHATRLTFITIRGWDGAGGCCLKGIELFYIFRKRGVDMNLIKGYSS